jgi:hypothetical protein
MGSRTDKHRGRPALYLLALCLSLDLVRAQASTVAPANEWERIERPESAGYSKARLEALRAGRQVVSREWVRRITSLTTPLHEKPPSMRALGAGNRWAYGSMWWVWDAPNSPGPFQGAYAGRGAGRRRSVSGSEYDSILRMLIAERCPGGRCD